jgi:hypothetical protein
MNRDHRPALHLLDQGFQCSSQGSFFSTITGGFGTRCERQGEALHVTLADGSFVVRERRTPGRLHHEVEILTETWFFDCASCWILPGSVANEAEIGGELVPLGTPLFHVHRTLEARIGEHRIGVVGGDELPEGMHGELHLRCEAGHWIVNARAVADDDQKAWIKHASGQSQLFQGGPIQRRILMRRTELVAPHYESQVRPHVMLPVGTKLAVGLAVLDGE